jgi:hypothetical protein
MCNPIALMVGGALLGGQMYGAKQQRDAMRDAADAQRKQAEDAARKQAEALRLRRPDMAPDELAGYLRCVGWMAIARDVLGLEP